MKRTWQVGVRADKALEILGEKGPLRYSSLLYALDIKLGDANTFKATLDKLVDAKILTVTGDSDPTFGLTDQKYADPAIAREEFDAYKAEKRVASIRATERAEAIALALASITRSMIEDIAFGMAEQGAKA